MSKPDPAFFLRACAAAKKDPQDVIYIGDHPNKDAIGASQAGLNGVWINRSQERSQEDVYSIERLTDLAPGEVLKWKK
jgi:putative hydrolase of the HAD superfamily